MTNRTTPCGPCNTANHDRCVSVIRNGDKTPWFCGCGCARSQELKCLDCGSRVQEDIDPEKAVCTDRESCATAQQVKTDSNPTIQLIREVQETVRARAEAAAPTRTAARSASVESGLCWCCGETTKGGKFLPGHDSRYLNTLADLHETGNTDQAEDLASAVSEKFHTKLLTRVANRKLAAAKKEKKAKK